MNSLFDPQKSVDEHLQTAIEEAIIHLDSGAIGGLAAFWLRAAEIAIELRRRLIVGPGDDWLDAQVVDLLSAEPNSNPLDFIDALNEDAKSEPIAPFRYAISIQLAHGLVQQLPAMQRRLYTIDAQLARFPLSPAARPYVSSTVESFLSSLDVGVVALARAGFEHAAQDWLRSSNHGATTDIERRSAGALLDLLIDRSALSDSAANAAWRIIRSGNAVMHRGGAANVTEDDAAGIIGDLAQVLAELVPRGSSPTVA